MVQPALFCMTQLWPGEEVGTCVLQVGIQWGLHWWGLKRLEVALPGPSLWEIGWKEGLDDQLLVWHQLQSSAGQLWLLALMQSVAFWVW